MSSFEFISLTIIGCAIVTWISNLFIQHLGHLPSVNWNNLLASIPTVLAAILTKNLLVIVLVGVFSLAFIQIIF